MATHKSALKRSRQSKVRRLRNRTTKRFLKNRIKDVLLALAEKSYEKARETFVQAIPAIDKAASKGVIHKRNASRKISRLARRINALKASSTQ